MLVKHGLAGDEAWVRSFEGGNIGNTAVAADDQGNVFHASDDAQGCSSLRKINGSGATIWTSALSDPPACEIGLTFLVPSSDGGVYAAGDFDSGEGLVVARFASDGAVDWSFVRDLEPDSQGGIWDLAVDSLGSVLTAGFFWNPGTDYLVMKIDSTGALVWERTFDNGSADAATSLAIGPQDRVTVVGYSYGETGADYYTIQYDAQGSELWHARVERQSAFGGFSWTPLPAIASDSNGNVYLTGSVGPQEAPELLLAKYASDGAQLADTHLPANTEGRRVVVVEPDDRVYVAAWQSQGELFGAKVVAFDLDGVPLWEESPSPPFFTVPGGLAARQGLVVMAGSVVNEAPPVQDTYWIGLDPDGTVLWQTGEPIAGRSDSYCAPTYFDIAYRNRSGSCLALGADGSTYVSGSEVLDYSQGYAHRTLKLAPDGSPAWTRNFIEPGEEVYGSGASASTLGIDGDLHVAGSGRFVVTYDHLGAEKGVIQSAAVNEVRAVDTGSSGAVYVLEANSLDIFLVKYLATGEEAWTQTFAGPQGEADQPLAMTVTGDDRVIYVGQTSVATGFNALARGYDSSGNVLLSKTFAAGGGDAWLAALASMPAGQDIVAAGRAESATDIDALVVRLDSAGNVIWRRDLDGDAALGEHGDDEASARRSILRVTHTLPAAPGTATTSTSSW